MNDEIPLFTEREQERVLEGEPVGTIVTRVNAIDRDGTFPNNQVRYNLHENTLININFILSDRLLHNVWKFKIYLIGLLLYRTRDRRR